MCWSYLEVFASSLIVDLIPVIAPPAWMVMVFFLMKFDLNPWGVLAAGVPGSTLGRYLLSLYIPKFSNKIIKRRKREELEFFGKKLSQKTWRSWLFVFLYTLTPISSTALFTAAGVARIKAWQIIPPFFLGKLVSDGVLILSGRYAAGNAADLASGTFSPKSIITAVIGLVVVGALMFVDWRVLLEKKTVKFNFGIWK
jgi:membrane protein YqaA with SNARE-associated domain